MELRIDSDVKSVAEFMQRNVATSRLVAVAESIGRLAPILWGGYEKEGIAALLLREDSPINAAHDQHTQPSAM